VKYQRSSGACCPVFIRDPAEVEDVAQEAFNKALPGVALIPGRQRVLTWLSGSGSTPRKNYLVAMGAAATTTESRQRGG